MAERLAWSTITVRGPDATTFLDGQLSQDLAQVSEGWAVVLEPTGTVISTLWARSRDEGWDLLVPTELADDATQRLRRFKVRVRCDLDVIAGAENPPLSTEDDLFESRWPWTRELAHHFAPHSYGRTFVARTISFTKGCYTGQELVGRMDARGATMPWRFVRALGPSAEVIDVHLRSVGPTGPAGVTRSRPLESGVEALGFAHRTLLDVSGDDIVFVESVS